MALIFDTEIINAIPPKDGDYLKGISYCKGWYDFKGMRLACLCAYDMKNNRVLVYGEDDISEFQAVIDDADYCVGYNNISFDNKLLLANGITIPSHKTIDLCDLLIKQCKTRYKLNDLCRVNFDVEKTEDGALAPVLWQRGEYFRVLRYCFNDVKMTAKLYRQIRDRQSILCPKTGQTFAVTMAQNGELF